MNDDQPKTMKNGRPTGRSVGIELGPAAIGAIVAAVAVLLFVVQNANQVRIKWLFLDGWYPLWFIIVITSLLTLIAERLGMFVWRRARHHEARSSRRHKT